MNPTERIRPTKEEYGMILAYAARLRSPDPHLAVGAAAFNRQHETIGTGYNGALPGQEIDWSDREARRPFAIHAEDNCLRVAGSTVHYLYTTLLPCKNCLDLAAKAGVKEIIYDAVYERDTSSLERAAALGILLRKFDGDRVWLRQVF